MSLEVFLWNLAFIILTNYAEFSGCQQDAALKKLVDDYWLWKIEEYPSAHNPHAQHIESFSVHKSEERKNVTTVFLQKANDININKLSDDDQLTLKLLKYQLDTFIKGYKWVNYGNLNPISQFEPAYGLSQLWAMKSHYTTFSGYMDYINKLEKVPIQLMEIRTLMERAIRLKRTNHASSMRGVVEDIYKLASIDPTESVYYEQFRQVETSISISPSDKKTLQTRGITVIRRIHEALNRLADWMKAEYMPNTRAHEGVWSLDNGSKYYMDALKWHLSIDMHPESVHQKGLMEVNRIKQKMENVMSFLNFSGDLPAFFQHLQSEQRFYNHTQEEYLQLYRDAVYNRIQPNLPLFFPNIENIPSLGIQKSFKDGIAASYWYPMMQVNTNNPQTRDNFTVLTISLHEALPGHHLQVSYTRSQKLPSFRRYFDAIRKYPVPFYFPYYTAYVEGWGLYAEYMGEEMGLFSNPYELFGRYSFEMFRACRLVVDTGIHMKGWTKQQAVTYLQKHTFMSEEMLGLEVDRYITWPGQACAYKIGELNIKELRQRAEQQLGYRFNVIDFHDAVLKVGPVPLDLLEDIVNKWIARRLDPEYSLSGAACSIFSINICVCLWLLTVNKILLHIL